MAAYRCYTPFDQAVAALARGLLCGPAIEAAATSGVSASASNLRAVREALDHVRCGPMPESQLWFTVPHYNGICTVTSGVPAGQVVARVPPLVTLRGAARDEKGEELVLTAWVLVKAPAPFVAAFSRAVADALPSEELLTLFAVLGNPEVADKLRGNLLGRLLALADLFPGPAASAKVAVPPLTDEALHQRLQLYLYVLRYRTRCPAVHVPPAEAPPSTWSVPPPALVGLPHTWATAGAALVPLFQAMSCGVSPHGGGTNAAPCVQCAASWQLMTQRHVALGEAFSVALAHPLPPDDGLESGHLLTLPSMPTGDGVHLVRCDGRLTRHGTTAALPMAGVTYPMSERARMVHNLAVEASHHFYQATNRDKLELVALQSALVFMETGLSNNADMSKATAIPAVMMMMCAYVAARDAAAREVAARDAAAREVAAEGVAAKAKRAKMFPCNAQVATVAAVTALMDCGQPLRAAETGLAFTRVHPTERRLYEDNSATLLVSAAESMGLAPDELERRLAQVWDFLAAYEPHNAPAPASEAVSCV